MTEKLRSTSLELARKLTEAFDKKELNALLGLWSEDCVIWHNFDNVEQNKHQSLSSLETVFAAFEYMRFTNIRCVATEFGFLQRHLLVGKHVGGLTFETPACLIATVRGDQICRVEEYLDPAPVFSLMAMQ